MNNISNRVQQRIETLPSSIKPKILNNSLVRQLKDNEDLSIIGLVEIAELLSTSLHWLLTGERDPEEVRLSARHSYNKETRSHSHDWDTTMKVMQNPILAYRQVSLKTCKKYEVIKENDPVIAAKKIRTLLVRDYGSDFLDDFPSAIEKVFGIDVFVIESDQPFEACAAMYKNNPFIVVKTSGAWYRMNFSFAHELAHILKDDLSYSSDIDQANHGKNERWANAFASELLMPKELVESILWKELSDEQLAYFIWNWGISTSSLSNRLDNLKLLDLSLGVKLYKNTLEFLEDYIDPSEILEKSHIYKQERFPKRLLDEHYAEFKKDLTNGSVLSWFLGVPVEDLVSDKESKSDVLLTTEEDNDWLLEIGME